MTDAHKAKLAFLTEPAPGLYQLNLQFHDGAFMRVDISKPQLSNIVVEGVRMALGARLEALEAP